VTAADGYGVGAETLASPACASDRRLLRTGIPVIRRTAAANLSGKVPAPVLGVLQGAASFLAWAWLGDRRRVWLTRAGLAAIAVALVLAPVGLTDEDGLARLWAIGGPVAAALLVAGLVAGLVHRWAAAVVLVLTALVLGTASVLVGGNALGLVGVLTVVAVPAAAGLWGLVHLRPFRVTAAPTDRSARPGAGTPG
jgi:hypothetical protein